ncbi:alpha-mannosidase [Pycnococcus provasolii]
MESGNYGPPPGFDWDPTRSASDFIQDDPWLEDYNLDGVVDDFVAKAHAIATLYRGKSDATCRLCGTCGGDDANQPPRWCTRLPDSAPATKTHASNVMIKMGSDFNYANAYGYFKEMDKLIHHVNERYGDQVNVFYSTPDRYTAARHAESLTWPCLGVDGAKAFEKAFAPDSPFFVNEPKYVGPYVQTIWKVVDDIVFKA